MSSKRVRGTYLKYFIVALVAVLHLGCARRQSVGNSPQLVVGSWGGAYQEAQRKAYFQPFARETGIKIIETSTPEYGKFYEWQRSSSASADVVDVETYFVLEAGRKGALQPIDYNVVPKSNMLPAALNEFGVASCAYADVIAWNSKLHPDWKDMTWADFWNTKKYEGARGLRDLPASTLEAALLADGVSPESLYPLDVTRAFRSLNRLRSSTRLALWSSGSEPIEWLLTGAVSITTAWNGRVHDAQQSGQPISMTFHNGMVDWLWWVVPRYSKNRDLAMKFIAFTLRPDRQAEFARDIPYGPTNIAALRLLDPQTAASLPTAQENLKQEILRDNKWWADHNEEIQPRWQEWKLGLGAHR